MNCLWGDDLAFGFLVRDELRHVPNLCLYLLALVIIELAIEIQDKVFLMFDAC